MAGRIFLDSDLIIFAALQRHPNSKPAMLVLRKLKGAGFITAWTYLEVLGVMSYRLGHKALDLLASSMRKDFHVRDITVSPELVYEKIRERMHAGDALILTQIELDGADAFVTFNVKDYKGRTHVRIMRPQEFLAY